MAYLIVDDIKCAHSRAVAVACETKQLPSKFAAEAENGAEAIKTG